MAVTITAPQSGYFDRTGAITVSWTNSITSPPQTAYEIMYKLKTASSWSTLGRVTSTATSANLKPIYDAVSQDAVEFYYKVVVYHDLATLSSGNKEGGVEHSAVYSIMFHGSQIATLKVQETASSTQTYPLFNGSTTPTAKLNVRTTSSATGTAPLVASGHPLAGKGKVITASGYTAFIGGSSPTFAASGQVRYGYFYGYRYAYSFTYYNYNYANYRTDSYSRLEYYYSRYIVDITSTHTYGPNIYWTGTDRTSTYTFNGRSVTVHSGQTLHVKSGYHGYQEYYSAYYSQTPYNAVGTYTRTYTRYNLYGPYRSGYAYWRHYYISGYSPSAYSFYNMRGYGVKFYYFYTIGGNYATRTNYAYYYYYYYTHPAYGYKPLIGSYTYRYYNRLWGPNARAYVTGYSRYVSSYFYYVTSGYRGYTYDYRLYYPSAYRANYAFRNEVYDVYRYNYTITYYTIYNAGYYYVSVWVAIANTYTSTSQYRVYRIYNQLEYYLSYYRYTYLSSYTNANRYWYTNNNSYNYQYYTR